MICPNIELEEETYSLQQIKVAFFRYFRGGGILYFQDKWANAEGSIDINWDGFCEELEKAQKGVKPKDGG